MSRNSADKGLHGQEDRLSLDQRRSLLRSTMVLSLPLVAGFFGRLHPAFDSFAHFRVHLAVLLILFALLSLTGRSGGRGLRRLRSALLRSPPFTAHLSFRVSAPSMRRSSLRTMPGPVYRLLQMNLRFDNPEPGKVLSLIGRLRPDIITLNEVSDMWREKLDLLSGAYPYRIVCAMENRAGGVAILSLRPFTEEQRPGASTAERLLWQ